MKKICIKCKEEKNLDRFDKRESSKDGYRNQCRNCMYIQRKEKFESLSIEMQNKIKERKRISNRKYRKKNKNRPEYKKKRSDRHKKRLKEDPLYKLRISYYRRINKCIKRFNTKDIHFLENLGCSLDDFKRHLESKFEPWMSWENYGLYNGQLNYGWDIDHIIPLSNASTEEEFYKLSHYSNMQPLCSKTNRDIKKDKIENPL